MCLFAQCANNSKDLALSTYIYKKLYPLMKDPVTPSGGHPMYYSNQIAFTKLQVDHMSKYTILYLYSKGMLMCFSLLVHKNLHFYLFVLVDQILNAVQLRSCSKFLC